MSCDVGEMTKLGELSSFRLMRLSESTLLNIDDDPSTSQEVAGAYLIEEIWGKV